MTAREFIERFKVVIRAEGRRQQDSGFRRSPVQFAEEIVEAVDMEFRTWDHLNHTRNGGRKPRRREEAGRGRP